MVEDIKRRYFGRTMTDEDLELVQWIIKTYKTLSQSEIINTICEALEWVRPEDGALKTMQCKQYLADLEKEGLIQLPAAKEKRKRAPASLIKIESQSEIEQCGTIALTTPGDSENNKLWRSYIAQFHMIGYKHEFGPMIRYFIESEGIKLGCLLFSASAWKLEDRDQWIGWSAEEKEKNLRLIINNSRFLIFPWVRIPNLASRALGMAARQIQGDWLKRFGYAPVLLETFVDTAYFQGTCYKAANWIRLGETKGRGRDDRYNEYALSKKAIFVYPLQKDFREVLKGQKPFMAVEL
jgi:hypothetical protein